MKKQEFHKIQVKIITTNFNQVLGIITVPINGYRSRLSDLLNNGQDFIAVTDVEIFQDNQIIEKTPFMCINKQAIMFLSEADLISSSTEDESNNATREENTI